MVSPVFVDKAESVVAQIFDRRCRRGRRYNTLCKVLLKIADPFLSAIWKQWDYGYTQNGAYDEEGAEP